MSATRQHSSWCEYVWVYRENELHSIVNLNVELM